MVHAIRHSLTALGVFAAHPAAFLIVAAYGVLWFIFQPSSFDWHGVATLVVWLMTLLIQPIGNSVLKFLKQRRQWSWQAGWGLCSTKKRAWHGHCQSAGATARCPG